MNPDIQESSVGKVFNVHTTKLDKTVHGLQVSSLPERSHDYFNVEVGKSSKEKLDQTQLQLTS